MIMEKTYSYKYPRPAVTADAMVCGFDGSQLHVLLIERGIQPFLGSWALPGGFMQMDETIEECAARELQEETGVSGVRLREFGVFSAVNRDPRGRVLTVAFLGLVNKWNYRLIAADDANKAEWFELNALPPLAFDHREIIDRGMQFLRDLIATTPSVLELMDHEFSLVDLQRAVELITGEEYDRRNFQRRLLQNGMLVPAEDAIPERTGGRSATMYTLPQEVKEELDELYDGMPIGSRMEMDIAPCCAPSSCEPEPEFDAETFMSKRNRGANPKPKRRSSSLSLKDFFRF